MTGDDTNIKYSVNFLESFYWVRLICEHILINYIKIWFEFFPVLLRNN